MPPAMGDSDGKRREPTHRRTERLDARVPPEVKEPIEHATGMPGTNVSHFGPRSSVEDASDAVRRPERARLGYEQGLAFTRALAEPAAPSPALRAAMREHEATFQHEG